VASACVSSVRALLRALQCAPLAPLPPLSSRYNFAKEEAVFKYEHTRGTLKLAAEYNLQVGWPQTAGYGCRERAALAVRGALQ